MYSSNYWGTNDDRSQIIVLLIMLACVSIFYCEVSLAIFSKGFSQCLPNSTVNIVELVSLRSLL